MIKTILGNVHESEIKTALCHEHICCYSEYLNTMSNGKLFDKKELIKVSVSRLKYLKEKYNMNLFIDCTPVNIGRNIDLLKAVSEESGVHIVCSTGFYYTDECVLLNTPVKVLSKYYKNDAEGINAGVIKAAVEKEKLTFLNEKLLLAAANTQLQTGLPIVMHTNANNQNGIKGLEILLGANVPSSAITVGHLSDTENIDYILKIAGYGCYIGLDRLYENTTDEYVSQKLKTINALIDNGFVDRILLSHDDMFYNGFDIEPKLNNTPRYNYVFDHILSKLPIDVSQKIISQNPVRMLKCQ